MTDQDALASGSLPEDDLLWAPGIKRRPRKGRDACYWLAPKWAVAKGYRPRSIALPRGLSEQEIAAACQAQKRDVDAWHEGVPSGVARYSIAWLVDRYLNDELSPYNLSLGHRAQRSYKSLSLAIKSTIGVRRIDPYPDGSTRILGESVRKWHRMWGRPNDAGIVTMPSRQRHLIVQLRILAKYAVEIGVPGARDLRSLLHDMRFSQPGPREVAPTRAQVLKIIERAITMGYPSMAMTTLAQFELIERRTHIIGVYVKGQWRPGWNWADISDDWVIRYFQTKVGRVERIFDLKAVPALLALLQTVPKERRIGAVMKDEHSGEPWRERHYAEIFRKVADAAGVPDCIKSMDMRAGGMTEADAIESIPDRFLQDAAGHTDPKTKDRYRRNKQRNANNVVMLRHKAREQT